VVHTKDAGRLRIVRDIALPTERMAVLHWLAVEKQIQTKSDDLPSFLSVVRYLLLIHGVQFLRSS
jgi:hypothetical protein